MHGVVQGGFLGTALRASDGALAAADKALELEPGNLRALILKADHFAEIGDARAASSFYQVALKSAPPADQLPRDLRADLARAQAMCARYAGDFESFLRDRLAAQVPVDAKGAARFARSPSS